MIPDFSTPGALDKVAQGADYIIHAAAPLPWDDIPEEDRYDKIVVQAIESITSVLETSKRTPSIKRVIYTASAAGTIPPAIVIGPDPSTKLWTSDDRNPLIPPPYPTTILAYVASKAAALHAAETWMAENKAAIDFDLVTLIPPYIIGRNDLLDTSAELEANTSNAAWFRILKGEYNERPLATASAAVEDVALMHVLSCDVQKVKGNQAVVFAKSFDFDDIPRVAADKFPKAVEKGWIRSGGGGVVKVMDVDISKAEQVFGIKLRSFEDMVESLVGQWVEVLEKEEAEKK